MRCILESRLKSNMKRSFLVAYLLTKMVPSLPSLNEIQDGCRCCCDSTFFHVFLLILKASIMHENRRNYDLKHFCSFWH